MASILHSTSQAKDLTGLDKILEEENALKLEYEIHLLLKEAVKCLDCDFLILPIDDIDMSFKYGFDVLERVRKYLASPYILPIITGNFRLYEHIFTTRFLQDLTNGASYPATKLSEKSPWLNGEKEHIEIEYTGKLIEAAYRYLKNEENTSPIGHAGRALELANLYLAKILPHHRRINLLGVEDIIERKILLKLSNGEAIKIKEAIEKIENLFNLGTSKRALLRLNPFPKENLRIFIQFLAVIEKFLHTNTEIDYKKFFKRIADFYEFKEASLAQDIYNFARANSIAFKSNTFNIKKFSQDADMLKYFEVKNPNKIIPYYTKENFKNKHVPKTDLDRLFYIISFEATINNGTRNGTRIYISPDKFFLWISAKLFSSNEFPKSKEDDYYTFGFDNVLFNYDRNHNLEGKVVEDEEDIEPYPSKYEEVKYQKGAAKKLEINIEFKTKFNCSSIMIWNLYLKYRENVDEILKRIKNEEEEFHSFVKRLVYAYANALAIVTIDNNRFTTNNICLASSDKKTLESNDLAYRWNIMRWDGDILENKIKTFIDNLDMFISKSACIIKGISPSKKKTPKK